MSTLLRLLRTRLAAAGITPDEANRLADLGHIEHLDVLATWLGDDDQAELVDSYINRLTASRARALGQQAAASTHPDERADAWGDITADEAVAWIDAMADADERDYPRDAGAVAAFLAGVADVLGVR